MKILEWVHRKFSPKHGAAHRPKDYSPGPQELSEEYPCGDTLTLQFSNWQHGLLAIGTFGLDARFDGEETVAHALKVIQTEQQLPFQKDEFVNVTVGLASEIDGAKPNVTVDDKDADCEFYDREKGKSNAEYKVGIKMQTLEHFFKESSPAGAPIHNNKKKSSTPQSLGNCLFGNEAREELIDVKRCNTDSRRKEDEAPERIGCSLVKKILKWKIKGSRSSTIGKEKFGADIESKLHKMKIQPEAAAADMGGLRSGCSYASKPFNIRTMNATELEISADHCKDDAHAGSLCNLTPRNVENSESIKRYGKDDVEEVGGSSNNSTTSWEETLSLSRDSSRGSREYWVKTDSEYVVLEL